MHSSGSGARAASRALAAQMISVRRLIASTSSSVTRRPLGDPPQLLQVLRAVRGDRSAEALGLRAHPRGIPPGRMRERLVVGGDRAADALARRLAVLTAALARPTGDGDPGEHRASCRTGDNARMAKYTVNPAGVARARELIDARQYVLRSEWGWVQPRAADENAYLESHSWDEYAGWYLGLTEGAQDETKARYAFVYGDFRRVHRMGLVACHVPRRGVAPQRGRARRVRAAAAPRRRQRLRREPRPSDSRTS